MTSVASGGLPRDTAGNPSLARSGGRAHLSIVEEPRGYIPAQPTRLVGRQEELAAAQRRVLNEGARLLTFTGPAGTGKTRLAVEVAAALQDAFEHGAYFVDLAPITDPELLAAAVTRAVGARETGGAPLLEHLKRSLGRRRILLLLDNFEQVLAAAPQVADLLTACPRLVILATSREALQLRWEHAFPVPTLALPDRGRLPDLEALARVPAIALFVERARAVKPDFALTEENARAVADVCVRLDGLPLAIELAAARSRMLTPDGLLARLQRSLEFLAGGPRDLPARHQTLRNAIAWSYDLLTDSEQALFRRLGIFASGCTLDAALAVAGAPGQDSDSAVRGAHVGAPHLALEVADGLESLLGKSLLRRDEAVGGETRFTMLETIREYALERLRENGDLDQAQRLHAAHYMRLALQGEHRLAGPAEVAWYEQLEHEHDNLRAALRWWAAQKDAVPALRLGATLWRFWFLRGHLTEGRRRVSSLLALPAERSCLGERVQLLYGAGCLAQAQGDLAAAHALFTESLALAQELGDRRGMAHALNSLGIVAMDQSNYQVARDLYEQSLALRRELGDARDAANTLLNLGVIHLRLADLPAARALLEESLAIFRKMDARLGIAAAVINLGELAKDRGDAAAAHALLSEGMGIQRTLGDKAGIASTLVSLAEVAGLRRDYQAARSLYHESMALREELEDNRGIAEVLEGLAGVAAAERQADRALRLAGAAAALREACGAPLPDRERERFERSLQPAARLLDEAARQAAWAAGHSLTAVQAIRYAQAPAEPPPPRQPPPPPASRLTPRERQVAALVARGLTNKEIADELVITEGTAAVHVEHIRTKLRLRSRAQVAVWAAEQGLLTTPPDWEDPSDLPATGPASRTRR